MPLLIGWAKDEGRQKRAAVKSLTQQQVKEVGKRRDLCVELLHLARDFRVLMENAYDSRDPVQYPDIKQVRQSAADIASQADRVEFNVPGAGPSAVALANEARKLSLTVEETNREHGASQSPIDFTALDHAIEEFKNSAQSDLETGQRLPG